MSHEISLYPAMDESGLNFFKKAIFKSTTYLEYGCGGSTSFASREAKVKNIISVDSSKEWVDKVNNSLMSSETNLFLNYCNLGEITDWGTPINRDKSQDFWQYMTLPWNVAEKNRLIPDLILIDGRFRVASFLYSLLCARTGTLIMFDDYLDRPQYFAVEKFCQLGAKEGRMGVFYVEHKYSLPEIVSTIAEFSTNWN